MANRVGQQLGNYRLVRFLGDGAFAEVYLGEQVYMATQAAIKVLHTQLTSQEAQKFQDEARTIARLKHPNIVRVIEFGVESKIPYLVMDYAPNGTLHDRHLSGTPVPVNTVVTYVKQVADALQYAHNAKLIHRDVKPENLLVGERNEILLSDFGIAVAAHSTRTQVIQDKIGTLPYMAPEQIDGYPVPASDQYALGIIVYQWLTGDLPFQGTDVEIITKHRHASPPSLRAKVPSIPPMVEQAVLMALQKDPKKRFASIQAFANALEQVYLQAIGPTLPVVTPALQAIAPTLPVAQSALPKSAASIAQTYPPVPTRRPGTLIYKYDGAYQSIVRSPEDKFIASVSGPIVEVWDLATGTNVSKYRHSYAIAQVFWSPDSTYIAISSNNQVIVLDATTLKIITSYNHTQRIAQIAWSPNGNWLASASDDSTIQIRVPGTGNLEFTYTGHFAAVKKVAWAFDSRLIASISTDNTIHLWDMLTGYTIWTYQYAINMAWSGNKTRLAFASSAQISILDIGTLRLVTNINFNESASNIQDIIWSPTSKFLSLYYYGYNSSWKNVVWDAATGHVPFSCNENNISWSPDEKLVAVWGSSQSKVQILDVATKKNIYTYTGHRQAITSVAWSVNGKRIASASNDGKIQLWNATDGSFVYTYGGHTSGVTNVFYSPDGGSIISFSPGSIQAWAAG